MIKVETIGMLDAAKVNPVITSESDVANYQFIKHEENVYLVANTLVGDDSYREDVVIKAGEYLNGYLVKAWEGQNLVIDAKHIEGEYATYAVKGKYFTIETSGKLKEGTKPEGAGTVYLSFVDKCTLTEKAIKARVCVA